MGDFLGVLPWRKQYFEGIETSVDIPFEDEYSYILYPEYNWVYNKLELCHKTGVKAFPQGIIPKESDYPIFSKPIINLYGMSTGARKYNRWKMTDYTPGHFWMPYFNGEHISSDFALVNGSIKWFYFTRGIKGRNDVFLHWEILPDISSKTYTKLISFINENFKDYTGFLNFETIDKYIIECHLRPNIELIDLIGGKDFINALVTLYNKHLWDYKFRPERGYSVVLRVPKTDKEFIIESEYIQRAEKLVNSIQITTTAYLNNDEFTNKLASINGFSLVKCFEAKQILKEGFDIDEEYK